jgi:tetratricopeptide (TPR) repeat protein
MGHVRSGAGPDALNAMRWLAAAGGLVLLAAGGLPWWESPIGRRIPSAAPGLAAVLGVLVLLLCALGRFGPGRARSALEPYRVTAASAALALTLVAWAVFDLAYADAALWTLVDDNVQYGQMVNFSRAHLTANLGFDPTYTVELSTEGAVGRLEAAYYFMGAGWWLALLLGVVLGVADLASKRWAALRWMAAFAACFGLFTFIVLSPALGALRYEARGDRQLAFGRYAEAVGQYGTAQGLAAQAQGSEQIWLRMGEAYVQLGMAAHPASVLYLADRDDRLGQTEAALSRLRLLTSGAPEEIQGVVRKRMANALVTAGLEAYGAGHASVAAGQWQEAMAVDPAQTQTPFFLSRAYFDLGQYDASIAMSRRVLARARNKILRADAQANIGDSYTRMGEYVLARQAYEASRNLDPVANFRILRSLGGT